MRCLSLSRRELLYCLSGAVFALVLFFTILSIRQRGSLEAQSARLRELSAKSAVMERSMTDMDGLLGSLAHGDGRDAAGPREVILASIDEIKKRLRASSLSLSAFDDIDGAISIEVEIEAPLGDYADFVRNIHYLESMSVPWFTVENIVIAGDEEEYNVRLRGVAMMPSEKVRGE